MTSSSFKQQGCFEISLKIVYVGYNSWQGVCEISFYVSAEPSNSSSYFNLVLEVLRFVESHNKLYEDNKD